MDDFAEMLASHTGFESDAGNARKNWVTHHVRPAKSEEVFFNRPVYVAEDVKHSNRERQYNVLGRTNGDRLVSVIFTVRRGLIRIISARPMSRKERTTYAEAPHEEP
jgi:uncharacterized DUF497 family protein